MNPGFIYAARNPFMPGLIKVGMTTGRPSQRLGSLASTSVPGEFELVFAFFVGSARIGEKLAHAALADFRVDPFREFFQVDPEAAKAAIEESLTRQGLLLESPIDVRLDEVEAQRKALNLSHDVVLAPSVRVHPDEPGPRGSVQDGPLEWDPYDMVRVYSNQARRLNASGPVTSFESALFFNGVLNRVKRNKLFVSIYSNNCRDTPVLVRHRFIDFVFVEMGDRYSCAPIDDMLLQEECVSKSIRMATPERALCDYLFVRSSTQLYSGAFSEDLGADWDLSRIDFERMDRLAEAAGVADQWSSLSRDHAAAGLSV